MRFPLLLALLTTITFLPSCDKDDDCSAPAVGLCPRETIVGKWAGMETYTYYRANEIVDEFKFLSEYEFRPDGTLLLPNFIDTIVDEWYWIPESSQLLTIRLPLSNITGMPVRNSSFGITSKFQVTSCSASGLSLELSETSIGVDSFDRYRREILLEKQP